MLAYDTLIQYHNRKGQENESAKARHADSPESVKTKHAEQEAPVTQSATAKGS